MPPRSKAKLATGQGIAKIWKLEHVKTAKVSL